LFTEPFLGLTAVRRGHGRLAAAVAVSASRSRKKPEVLNIGLEGKMLIGAYHRLLATYRTGSSGSAFSAGGVGGMSAALIVLLLPMHTQGLNQIVIGIAITVGAEGLTSAAAFRGSQPLVTRALPRRRFSRSPHSVGYGSWPGIVQPQPTCPMSWALVGLLDLGVFWLDPTSASVWRPRATSPRRSDAAGINVVRTPFVRGAVHRIFGWAWRRLHGERRCGSVRALYDRRRWRHRIGSRCSRAGRHCGY